MIVDNCIVLYKRSKREVKQESIVFDFDSIINTFVKIEPTLFIDKSTAFKLSLFILLMRHFNLTTKEDDDFSNDLLKTEDAIIPKLKYFFKYKNDEMLNTTYDFLVLNGETDCSIEYAYDLCEMCEEVLTPITYKSTVFIHLSKYYKDYSIYKALSDIILDVQFTHLNLLLPSRYYTGSEFRNEIMSFPIKEFYSIDS